MNDMAQNETDPEETGDYEEDESAFDADPAEDEPEEKHLEEIEVLRIELARANREKLMLASGNLELAAKVRGLELQNFSLQNTLKSREDEKTHARIEGMSANASQKLEAVQKEIGEKYDLGKGTFTYDPETREITVTEPKDDAS